jgi:hypothetical protein
MFWNNYGYYNPAFNGMMHSQFGMASYRNQWDGFSGRRNTIMAGYGEKILINRKTDGGMGIQYAYDQPGILNKSKLNLNFNFQINIGDTGKLAIGGAIGFTKIKISNRYTSQREFQTFSTPMSKPASTSISGSYIPGVHYCPGSVVSKSTKRCLENFIIRKHGISFSPEPILSPLENSST